MIKKTKFIISCCITLLLAFSNVFAANKYLEAGIPASDRQWNGVDYLEAADKFSKGIVDLPTMADKEGTALFKRIVSVSNLELCKGKTTSPEIKIKTYMGILAGAQKIFIMYIEKRKYSEKMNDEISAFSSFILDAAVVGENVVNEFIPTIPKNDANYDKRMAGISKVGDAFTQIFVAAERSLSDTNFTSSNINTIAIAMSRTLPVLKSRFSANFKEELKIKLTSRYKEATDATLKNVLNAMINELAPSSV